MRDDEFETTVIVRYDDDGAERSVRVPSDPRVRLEIARERGSDLAVDATKALKREREQWS